MAVQYVNFVNVGTQLEFQMADFQDKELNIVNSYTQILSATKIWLHVYDTLLPEESGMVSDPYTS